MRRVSFLVFFISFLFPFFINAQSEGDLNTKIPLDTSITFGRLNNGLTYYIKTNHKPEDRAVLRLVVNAGSVLEDDDQLGLAHFVEHMGFNGTKNFKKHELIDYLESIGMKFGPEVNAYTSFDQTVYMIDVPTDSAEMVEKGIQILEEWAHYVSFEDEEIDKERGVIEEEWRLGRGAGSRMFDKQFPIIFKNSQYAKRITIGDINIIRNFKHDVLRRFYKDWYRPDLMAVVAVGDFDKSWMESLIKKHFNNIPDPADERERINYPVPENDQTEYALAADPEATNTMVSIYYKMNVQPEKTLAGYRQQIVENLFNGMLRDRFNELAQKPDPPFIYAYSAKGNYVRTKNVFMLNAMVKEDGIEKGFKTLLEEAERVEQFGFTQTELDRQKESLLRDMEQNYNERDKTESRKLASEYIGNFLNDEPVPGIEYEYNAYKNLLPGISLDEVNKLAGEWTGIKDRVIVLSATEKAGLTIPGEKDFRKIIDEVQKEKLESYKDIVSNLPLVNSVPAGTKILSETKIPEIDAEEWTLGNGAKVIVKPTDFKNDEILFNAFSKGGSSLENDEDYQKTLLASGIIQLSGIGKFDYITLNKMLSGKIVRLFPYIGELSEGLNGNTAPQDFETLLQLIYLYFTSPRIDSSAFLSYKERIESYIKNKSLSPEQAFMDSITVTLAQHNPRRQPMNEELVSKADLGKSFEFYKERFADASDFYFVFVGNIDTVKMKPAIEKYIGGLPSFNKSEQWKDLKY